MSNLQLSANWRGRAVQHRLQQLITDKRLITRNMLLAICYNVARGDEETMRALYAEMLASDVVQEALW